MSSDRERIEALEAELARTRQEFRDRSIELEAERDKATAADAAKAKFLATLSHELRTPLNAIIGFSELMHTQQLGPLGNSKYLTYLEDIRDSGKHLLSLVDDLLSISKMQAGRMVFEDREVDPVELIESVGRLLGPEARKRSIRIDIRLAPNLGLVMGDERALRQMLINIMGNAIRYSDNSGHIVVSAKDPGDGGLTITVADNGIGIPADKLDRVFEPFVQASDTLSRSHDGAGLGLAIARSMAQFHEGEIGIESEEGVGTTVTISLPASRVIHDDLADDMTQFDDDEDEIDSGVWLTLVHDERTCQIYQDGGEFIIGRPDPRRPDLICDLAISDPRISRPHARIIHSHGQFFLIDQSRRGSYVVRDGGKVEFVHQNASAALDANGCIFLADEPGQPGVIQIDFILNRDAAGGADRLQAVS